MSNSDESEHEYVYQFWICSCNHYVDDCDEIMNLELADVSHIIFQWLDEAVTYGKDMLHDMIIDNFSMLKIDFTIADNHESTLGTSTNDYEKDTGTYTNIYSGKVNESFGLIGNSTNIGNISANISGPNYDHKSCVEDELHSNFDSRDSSVDDETNSNCDACLIENEFIRLDNINTNDISLAAVDPNHTCQAFCLKYDSCNGGSGQDSYFEGLMSCLDSNYDKPSKCQKI